MALPHGWTAWITERAMLARLSFRPHPFCRGYASAKGGPWFPRTSTRPMDDRFAVPSAAGQLPCFDRDGWFVTSHHIPKHPDFVPTVSQECGRLDDAYVASLHEALAGFFTKDRRR